MKSVAVIPAYVKWHYTEALSEGFHIVTNFIWFFYHFFSVSFLAKTLFAKFEQLGEEYSQEAKISALASTFAINMIMRVVGACIRIIVILVALIAIVCTGVLGIIFLAAWLLLPLIVVGMWVAGSVLLINGTL